MRIVAIGAGQAGLGFGIKLKKMGHSDFVIYEKGHTVGGVWRENTYPGVRCDAPSQGYCYSFAPSGLWKKKYSGGNDIRRYFERAARTFNVAQHVKLNKEVISAEWTGKRWKLEISDGTTDFADILVSATGVLHRVAYPDIPGLETFEGHVFHSAEWDHSVDIDGKAGWIGRRRFQRGANRRSNNGSCFEARCFSAHCAMDTEERKFQLSVLVSRIDDAFSCPSAACLQAMGSSPTRDWRGVERQE